MIKHIGDGLTDESLMPEKVNVVAPLPPPPLEVQSKETYRSLNTIEQPPIIHDQVLIAPVVQEMPVPQPAPPKKVAAQAPANDMIVLPERELAFDGTFKSQIKPVTHETAPEAFSQHVGYDENYGTV